MPKSFARTNSKIKEKPSLWKKWVPAFVLFSISIVLFSQTLYCYFNAQNFPVGASDLTRTRYDPTLSSNPPEIFSVVGFLACPVESGISCEITLTSLEEVGVKLTDVSYLTDNGTVLDVTRINMFPIDKMTYPTVTLNGQPLTPFLSNATGLQCYTVNGYNLTDTTQVETVVVSFNVKRAISNNKFVKIPWVFDENYPQFVKFPATNTPLDKNKTSDESTFKIDFELPFRQLVTGMSGWVDEFDLPYSYWVFVNSTSYYETMVEYPINQTVYSSGNTYYFNANFSEQNAADSYMITIIPNLGAISFLFPFMLSPVYILIVEYGRNRYAKGKPKNSNAIISIKDFFRVTYLFIIGIVVYLAGSFGQLLSLLSYLTGIMSPVGFFVLFYPVISFVVLRKTCLKS
jgi:hypothetical protein